MRFVLLLLAMACAPAVGKVIGTVESPRGAYIELTDETGPCILGARLALFKAIDGTVIPGCWVYRGGSTLTVAFVDGDASMIPAGAVQEPKTL